MRLSEESQAIRKKAHLARVAAKSQPGYPALYGSQPHEIAKGNEQRAARQLTRGIKNQADTAARAAAESAASVFSGVALTDGSTDGDAE